MGSVSGDRGMKDLTVENITENVHAVNAACENPRLKFLLEKLVGHLHDFARETRLSIPEWEAALEFLVEVGQISSPNRHEFILLSDVLGLSLLVDSIYNAKPKNATEGTVLGPFHTSDAREMQPGDNISHDAEGEPLLAVCTVKDMQGKPIPDVAVDVWETDSKGFYDVQYADRAEPDGRAIIRSDENGLFFFKGIVPVSYPIPHDGPVGKLLSRLNRHHFRPSHMHFMFKKQGFAKLVTALYPRGDPYESSDAVFGVKDALIVDLETVGDVDDWADRYQLPPQTRLLRYNFVLASEQEVDTTRDQNALKEVESSSSPLIVQNGVLVPRD